MFFSVPAHIVSVQLMSSSELAKLITTNLTRKFNVIEIRVTQFIPHPICFFFFFNYIDK